MFRKLRVLAAFFMVPVVFMASPAAASTGPWSTVSIGVDASPIPTDLDATIDCAFSLQQSGGYALNVASNGYCLGLPDVSWGFAQDGEAGSAFTISASGVTTSAGVSCSGSMSSTFGPHSANGTVRVAGTITAGTLGISANDCNVTQVCLSLRGGAPSCVAVDIPAVTDAPVTSDGCAIGTPHAWLSAERVPHPQYGGYFLDEVYLNFTLTGAGVSTGSWHATVNGGHVTNITTTKRLLSSNLSNGSEPLAPLGTQQKIQVYATGFSGFSGNPAPDPLAAQVAYDLPPGWNTSYQGWTDSPKCRFYFGPKIVESATLTGDDPMGTGVDPYADPPPVDYPEPVLDQPDPIAEPDTDLGWLGKIWALLDTIWRAIVSGFRSVVNALAGIATAIVDGITGAFEGMFVPADGFLEARYTTLETKWGNTSPAKYADAASGFTVGAASGCGGLPLNVTLPGGVQINESIGAACSGSMASAAGITRAVLTAVLVVSGMFACVRAVGSGLGWNPGIGRGGAA